METELLRIFDEDGHEAGTATREEVHRNGYWHETFHCWFIQRSRNHTYLYFQLRSGQKKDYPNLLDITAAGHLLAHESVGDGLREVEEETGIQLRFNQLSSLGIIPYKVEKGDFRDYELAHTFLHECTHHLQDFRLQKEEVAGMVLIPLNEFKALWWESKEKAIVSGISADQQPLRMLITKDNFVPHEDAYYLRIVEGIQKAKET
ncbi:MAG: NUDIX domain-containing protein [Bacillus sp. (in: firmicutes)]